MKLCIDCKHYAKPTLTADFGLCRHPKNLTGGEPCLIDGDVQPEMSVRDPYELRHFGIQGTCDKDGHWWEKK